MRRGGEGERRKFFGGEGERRKLEEDTEVCFFRAVFLYISKADSMRKRQCELNSLKNSHLSLYCCLLLSPSSSFLSLVRSRKFPNLFPFPLFLLSSTPTPFSRSSRL